MYRFRSMNYINMIHVMTFRCAFPYLFRHPSPTAILPKKCIGNKDSHVRKSQSAMIEYILFFLFFFISASGRRMSSKIKYIYVMMRPKFFFYSHLITDLLYFYYIFFCDQQRSNAIDGSDFTSSAFWKKRTKTFLITIRFFQQRKCISHPKHDIL